MPLGFSHVAQTPIKTQNTTTSPEHPNALSESIACPTPRPTIPYGISQHRLIQPGTSFNGIAQCAGWGEPSTPSCVSVVCFDLLLGIIALCKLPTACFSILPLRAIQPFSNLGLSWPSTFLHTAFYLGHFPVSASGTAGGGGELVTGALIWARGSVPVSPADLRTALEPHMNEWDRRAMSGSSLMPHTWPVPQQPRGHAGGLGMGRGREETVKGALRTQPPLRC